MLCALVLYYAIIKINNHYATVSLVSVGYIFLNLILTGQITHSTESIGKIMLVLCLRDGR